MKKIDLIENQEYDLTDKKLEDVVGGGSDPFISGGLRPFSVPKTRKNNVCPKCGATIQSAVCKFVDGRGLEMIVSCWEDGLHWISEEYEENTETPYTFVEGKIVGSRTLHVIPKPF